MPKTRMEIRIDPDLLRWADGYAEQRGWTRTQVMEEAVRSLRGDARAGVPELPAAVAGEADQAERSVPAPKRRQLQHGDRVPSKLTSQKPDRPEPPPGYSIPKIAPRRYPWDQG